MERTCRPGRAPLAAAAASAALTLLVLTGCSAGFDATSSKPYAPSDGIQAESGDLRVLNALVVAEETGTTGVVSTTIVNTGESDDRLTGITSPDATVLPSGPSDLPAGGTVTLGAGSDTSATLSDLTKHPGETVTLKISFASAEPVTLRTVVVPASGYYAEFTPFLATPTPTPTPTSTSTATSTPSPSP